MIFVDTGPLYAMAVPTDEYHESAVRWYTEHCPDLVTTDLIVYEVLTLLRSRGHKATAIDLGNDLFSNETAVVEWITRGDVEAAWRVFREFDDKDWSFADCVSRVVMERLGIERAFAFDEHFRQFGTVTVVP